MTEEGEPVRRIGVVVFDRFELLDVCGPLEMFGVLPDHFDFTIIGPHAGAVRSAQGPSLLADVAFSDAPPCEVVLVPGGIGNRGLIDDRSFLRWLATRCNGAEYVLSVCTGAALLARAGVLDGRRATSNKRSFAWVREQSARVEWVTEARWVEDGNCWTSSGVAAGIDMALAFIARLHGDDIARAVADGTEYDWHDDADWDPFAAKHGLVAR